MFLTNEEKIIVMLHRIDMERWFTLYGKYKDYSVGERKIRKMKDKIIKLGGNPDVILKFETK